MKRKTISLVLIVFLVIAGGLGWYLIGRPRSADRPLPLNLGGPGEQAQSTPVKYSLDYLREKQFGPSPITTEQTVRETAGFTSFTISYQADGLTQYALMNVPNQGKEKYPVVIVNHGYIPPDQYSTTQSYINTSAFYANNGFLVVKPDYRGHNNSQTNNQPNSRLAYAVDVLTLLNSLENIDQADTDNVFMYGHSMGGDITLRILESSNKIKAASLWAPVARSFPESILFFIRKNRDADRIREFEKEIFDNYTESEFAALNPLNYLDRVDTPVIVHHGSADQSVPYQWSVDLVEKLNQAGKPVEFFTYQNDNHDIAGNFTTALNRDVAFFRSNLVEL
jgi:dipeptidyl aminopeptidase/acylaminoacyl peptidase